MKVLVILAALVATASAARFLELVLQEWETFKTQHRKRYSNDVEDKFRMKIYIENRLNIAKHNARFARGEVSYALDANHFTDLLTHEFVDVMNGFNRTARKGAVSFSLSRPIERSIFVPAANVVLPSAVDWRTKGAVTPVKNQGHCGSCYSFSATGALEGQHFLKTGRLVSLSEQNIMDCSKSYGNNGCQGGLMDNAFKYIRDNRGIDTEKAYPYEGLDENCHYTLNFRGATATGLVDIPSGDEEALKQAVGTVGPVSIAIDAGHQSFQFYKTGVYFEEACSSESLDHGVLLVGYGTDNGTDYWLVKNSWGEEWGEGGHIRIARNRNNHCGVATTASYPLV